MGTCRPRQPAWLHWSLVMCAFVVYVTAQSCEGDPPVVLNNRWDSCKGTPSGSLCQGKCNRGYTETIPGPTVVCRNGQWQDPVGDCNRVCPGKPPAYLIDQNAVWPDDCSEQTAFREYCTAICVGGAVGSPTIMCGGSAGWAEESFSGRCVKGPACLGMPQLRLINGHMPTSCTDSPLGAVCTGSCNRGYGGPKPPTVTCVADARSPTGASWQEDIDGACDPVCDGLPPAHLLRGVSSWPAVCADATVHNTACSTTCPGAYGDASVMCMGHDWALDTFTGGCFSSPTCLGTPGAPVSNGRFTSSCSRTNLGGSCTGTCSAGYTGSPTVACVADAQSPTGASWAATSSGSCVKGAPACVGTPPASITGGFFPSTCASTAAGGSCTAVCNAGFAGSPAVACVPEPNAASGALWSTRVTGSCTPAAPAVCPGTPPASLANGLWPSSCASTAAGSSCRGVCSTGFSGSPSVACLVDASSPSGGSWSSAVSGSCTPIPATATCPGTPPVSVSSGSFPSSCAGMSAGSSCVGVCSSGYSGAPTVACVADQSSPTGGSWSPTVTGGCTAVAPTCPGLPSVIVSNGVFPSTCANAAAGSSCTATCSSGFSGSPTVACVLNPSSPSGAAWSTTVTGSCSAVSPTCAGLPAASVANGAFPSTCANAAVGSSCKATCNTGFNGSPAVACVADPNAPTRGSWSMTVNGTCTPVPATCPGTPPVSVSSGSFPSSCAGLSAGSSCVGVCSSGFSGAPTVACVANQSSPTGGSWSPTVTGGCTAVIATCAGTPSASLPNGSFPSTCASMLVGTSCQGNCSSGFAGSPSVTCVADASSPTGGSWAAVVNGSCVQACTSAPSTPLANGAFPTTCANTPAGGVCRGVCNTDFAGQPVVGCIADPQSPTGASWATAANGSCVPASTVCRGAPPAALLQDGSWPANCTDQTLISGTCTAVCKNFGSATINCAQGGWDSASFTGQCTVQPTTTACKDPLPTILNGAFPPTCTNGKVGTMCTAQCNAGFAQAGSPVMNCTYKYGTSDIGQWTAPVPSLCEKDAVVTGTAYMVSAGDLAGSGALVICSVTDQGDFRACKASNAAVGSTAALPLNFPNGIAVDGQYVWLSDKNARVRVCTLSGNTIVTCSHTTGQTSGLEGSGSLAVDKGRGLLFAVLDLTGCVLVCSDIYALSRPCPCYTFAPLDTKMTYPVGLTIAYDQLWITSMAGVSKCPLTAFGFNTRGCVTTKIFDPADPEGKAEYNTGGIFIDTAGSGTVYLADYSQGSTPGGPSVLACNVALTSCYKSLGNGTFFNTRTRDSGGPGYAGMAVSGGFMYVPLQSSGTPSLSVCSQPSTISGCKPSQWSTTPPLSSNDTVNLVVVPKASSASTALSIAELSYAVVDGLSIPVALPRRQNRRSGAPLARTGAVAVWPAVTMEAGPAQQPASAAAVGATSVRGPGAASATSLVAVSGDAWVPSGPHVAQSSNGPVMHAAVSTASTVMVMPMQPLVAEVGAVQAHPRGGTILQPPVVILGGKGLVVTEDYAMAGAPSMGGAPAFGVSS